MHIFYLTCVLLDILLWTKIFVHMLLRMEGVTCNNSIFIAICYFSFFLLIDLQMLTQLGIERLVLPAIPALQNTWRKFGFTQPSLLERLELLGYPLLIFQKTTMFQKVLNKSTTAHETTGYAQELQEKGGGHCWSQIR